MKLPVYINVLGNNCKSFRYIRRESKCDIYQDVIRYDYNENVTGTCKGYQIMPDCTIGFKYLLEGNKCLNMISGNWDWYKAKQVCNSLHPRSHPVIADLKNDSLLFSRFYEKEILPNSPGYNTYLSAGFSLYINGSRDKFQWSFFPGVVQPLKATTPWNSGEPNFYSLYFDLCIHLMNTAYLNDCDC